MIALELKNFHLKYKKSGFEIGPNFNLSVDKGDFLGLVGESGCGKSSIGKVLISLINHEEKDNFGVDDLQGELYFPHMNNDINYLNATYSQLRILRKNVQMIFQNPRSALNLKMPVINTLYESAKIGNPELNKKDLLKIIYDKVIKTQFLHPRVKFEDFLDDKKIMSSNGSLSGGERRRVSIAKVMCMNPSIIIADEPLASLDASIKLDILNYLIDEWKMRKETDNPLTLILISHDVGVVSNVCNKVAVMYGDLITKKGEIVEKFVHPRKFKLENSNDYHSYTNELITASKYFMTDG